MVKNMKMTKPKISWFTPPGLGIGGGYGYAAVQTIEALQFHGVQVPFEVHNEYMSEESDAYAHISFVQPEHYQGTSRQYRIGYTPWESSEIPEHWKIRMQEMNEIWTPSNYIADIYRDNKVNEIIRVIPHGIDPEVWEIENRFVREKFIFFHVGGPTERKGGQRVVDAFLDLFGDNKDVMLVMKSSGPSEARVKYRGEFGNCSIHDRIMVIEDVLDVYQLAQLYAKAHCLVYPTNGEGFGLIPFQGIATGLPTIVTDATACSDYAKLAIPLDWKPTPGNGIHLGNWAEPNLDDLRDKMKWVYENYDRAKETAMQSARIVHATQTWDAVAGMIMEALGDKPFKRI
jgi:glycosyltransferase involved in cell wall biosynthesis